MPVGKVRIFVVQLFLFVLLYAAPVVGGVDVRVAHAAFGEVHFWRPVFAFWPEEEGVADAFGVGEAGAHFPAAAAGGVEVAAADAFAGPDAIAVLAADVQDAVGGEAVALLVAPHAAKFGGLPAPAVARPGFAAAVANVQAVVEGVAPGEFPAVVVGHWGVASGACAVVLRHGLRGGVAVGAVFG